MCPKNTKAQVGIADKITPEEYAKEYDAWLDVAYLSAPALPGAKRLVEHFAAKSEFAKVFGLETGFRDSDGYLYRLL